MIEKKWFAVCTRSGWEKKVAESLAKRRIEHYWPVNKIHREFSDRKKAVCEPLFTAYVFVSICETEKTSVLQIPGVQNFVYWLGQPAVIPNEEIITIKHFLNEYPLAKVEKTQVNLEENVRFINGPQMTRKGNLLEVRNNDVKVILPSLGYTMMSELRKEYSEGVVATLEDESLKVRI